MYLPVCYTFIHRNRRIVAIVRKESILLVYQLNFQSEQKNFNLSMDVISAPYIFCMMASFFFECFTLLNMFFLSSLQLLIFIHFGMV